MQSMLQLTPSAHDTSHLHLHKHTWDMVPCSRLKSLSVCNGRQSMQDYHTVCIRRDISSLSSALHVIHGRMHGFCRWHFMPGMVQFYHKANMDEGYVKIRSKDIQVSHSINTQCFPFGEQRKVLPIFRIRLVRVGRTKG